MKMIAVQKSCERLLSSRSEKIAAIPPTVSTAMKSSGYCSIDAQMSTTVMCVMKAVRESMNTLTKMGTMANGKI